jgi:hypothetical protein
MWHGITAGDEKPHSDERSNPGNASLIHDVALVDIEGREASRFAPLGCALQFKFGLEPGQ